MIENYAANSNLKTVALELGGKSPMIVFDDADVDMAVSLAHTATFLNQGQVCCAGSRTFVQEGIYDKFVEAMANKAAAMKVGGCTEENIEQGPQIDDLQFQKVLGYVQKGKDEGATLATGGGRYGPQGYFVQPTVFTGEY